MNVKNGNQLFDNMLQAALDNLSQKDPMQIARLAGVEFDGSAFRFLSLGRMFTVQYPKYEFSPFPDQWHVLTILHDLALADGTPLSDRQMTFAQYKDGMIRGGGFDRDVEKGIQQALQTMKIDELERRCMALGAKLIPSNADLCTEFHFMPNYPVWLKIWLPDEDFPASGKMLLDASAEHYLTIEDAVAVGGLILNSILC